MASPDFSVGQIAEDLGVTRDRVQYAIRSRGIAHTRRAGMVRMFDRAAVAQIRTALGLDKAGSASGHANHSLEQSAGAGRLRRTRKSRSSAATDAKRAKV